MSRYLFRFLTTCAFVMAAISAHAQEEEGGASADALIQRALSALQQIDQDRSADLWEKAAAPVKARFTKDEFIQNTRQSRKSVGAVAKRTWASVVRLRYTENNNASIVPGLYANLDFSTQLSDGKTAFELVSLRFESGEWKLMGYVPRDKQ